MLGLIISWASSQGPELKVQVTVAIFRKTLSLLLHLHLLIDSNTTSHKCWV